MRRPVSVPQILVLLSALAGPATVLHAQGGAAPAAGRAGGAAAPNLTAAEPMGPVENLTAYPVPPEGFNVARDNIPHGEVKLVEYDSKTLGIRRPLRVYTPPGRTAHRSGRAEPVEALLAERGQQGCSVSCRSRRSQ